MQCSVDEKRLTVKIVRVLRLFEDVDMSSLDVKRMIAECIVEEVKSEIKPQERGL